MGAAKGRDGAWWGGDVPGPPPQPSSQGASRSLRSGETRHPQPSGGTEEGPSTPPPRTSPPPLHRRISAGSGPCPAAPDAACRAQSPDRAEPSSASLFFQRRQEKSGQGAIQSRAAQSPPGVGVGGFGRGWSGGEPAWRFPPSSSFIARPAAEKRNPPQGKDARVPRRFGSRAATEEATAAERRDRVPRGGHLKAARPPSHDAPRLGVSLPGAPGGKRS